MAESLSVDPLDLHTAGGDVLDAMDESVRAHAAHHEALESAMPGLPGEAAGALQGLIVSWTEQREALHRTVGHHGVDMQDAATRYLQTDHDQGDAINQLAVDMGL